IESNAGAGAGAHTTGGEDGEAGLGGGGDAGGAGGAADIEPPEGGHGGLDGLGGLGGDGQGGAGGAAGAVLGELSGEVGLIDAAVLSSDSPSSFDNVIDFGTGGFDEGLL